MAGRYAIIDADKVTNVVLAEADFAAERGWVSAPDYVGRGFTFDGTNWTAPSPARLTARESARNHVSGLADSVQAALSAATSNAATIAGVVPGAPLTVAQVDALSGVANGLALLLDTLSGIIVLVT